MDRAFHSDRRTMTTLRALLRVSRRAGLAQRAAVGSSELYTGAASVSTTATRGFLSTVSGPAAVTRSARSSLATSSFARSGVAGSRFFSAEDEKKDDETEEAGAEEEGGDAGDETEQLRTELEEKDAQVKDLNDKLLRTLADMENLRERTRRQAESAEKFAIQGFCKDLLDVADNLGRAVSTVDIGDEQDAGKTKATLVSLHEGVLMVEKQLVSAFAKHGVEKYDPTGDQFDPNDHMALFNVPMADGAEAGTVAAVTKAGYKLHDRVIRPAEVGVYQA